jgi:hypothetical protein
MPDVALAAVWIAVGAACAVGHGVLLQRAVAGTPYESATDAKRAIVRGFGLRLALYLPVLCLVANGGWLSSIAWLVGHWLARAILVQRATRGGSPFSKGAWGPQGSSRGH